MFPPSLLVWTGISLVFLVVGLVFGNVVLLTGSVFVLLVVLLAAALPPPSGVTIEKILPRVSCSAGDSLTVSRRITITGGVGLIFVHDKLPAEARIVEGSNLRVVWKWPGTVSVDISYQVHFPKRGQFKLEETIWESQAPFGINRRISGVGGSPVEVTVIPRIRSIMRLNHARVTTKISRYQGHMAQIGGGTNDFRELRPYATGDPLNRINWKATARGHRSDNLPLVNVLDPEAQKAVWIFLDIADYMDVGTPLSNPLEHTLEASGSLAQYYLTRGSTLGAFAYNSSTGNGELLTPDSGRKQFHRLVRMLSRLKSGPPQQDLLQAVEWCKSHLFRLRPEVFIITRLDVLYARPGETMPSLGRFRAAVDRLTSLRSRSQRFSKVRVVHVSPQEPDANSRDWGLIKWETMRVTEDLRKGGASVIEWQPEEEEFIVALVRHMGAYR